MTLVLMALAGAFAPAMAQQIDVAATRRGGQVTVTASAELAVDAGTVWAVISDYDHLADFIPYMHSSRVLQRDGDRLLVAQTGELSMLFFHQPVDVQLEVMETPRRRIAAHAVAGNLRSMEGLYAIDALPSGEVRLSYSGGLQPEFPVPPLIGTMVVRMVLEKQFRALVAEIMRRDAAAHALPAR